jgi:hypothetical protein
MTLPQRMAAFFTVEPGEVRMGTNVFRSLPVNYGNMAYL